jgi:integrase
VLGLLALTACRSNEIRGLKWDEIDVDAKLMTIPPERMKRGAEFKVPLSAQAVALLKALHAARDDSELVFPASAGLPGKPGRPAKPGRSIPNATVWAMMQRVTDGKATTHGLRASFRTWCGDVGVAREVSEACLAHAKGDAVEAAYNRSEMVERRRAVMVRWADFLDGKASAKVTDISAAKRKRP